MKQTYFASNFSSNKQVYKKYNGIDQLYNIKTVIVRTFE